MHSAPSSEMRGDAGTMIFSSGWTGCVEADKKMGIKPLGFLGVFLWRWKPDISAEELATSLCVGTEEVEINVNFIFANSERLWWFIFLTNNLQLGSAGINCSSGAPGWKHFQAQHFLFLLKCRIFLGYLKWIGNFCAVIWVEGDWSRKKGKNGNN